jgi:hypothetical protein
MAMCIRGRDCRAEETNDLEIGAFYRGCRVKRGIFTKVILAICTGCTQA